MKTLNKRPFLTVLRDGAVIAAASALVAVAVNAIRPDGIAFFENKQYEIFVPCPEPIGEVEKMSPVEFLGMKEKKALIIDARSEENFGEMHFPGAINIPFDYLMPVCMVRLKDVASSGATKVVVYGDGADPDSGHELARELSGSGIKNVFYVEGGAGPILTGKTEAKP
jgi:hypothetical protein